MLYTRIFLRLLAKQSMPYYAVSQSAVWKCHVLKADTIDFRNLDPKASLPMRQ